jgi:AbrB family looped-hinge helix DNA binding protein
MRVTSKGQVTIPIEIRRMLGMGPETEVEFDVVGQTILIRIRAGEASRGQLLVDRLRGKATREMTTDQILAITRG